MIDLTAISWNSAKRNLEDLELWFGFGLPEMVWVQGKYITVKQPPRLNTDGLSLSTIKRLLDAIDSP